MELVEGRFVRGGLVSLGRSCCTCNDDDGDDDDGNDGDSRRRRRLVLRLTTTQDFLEETAELIHWMKPCYWWYSSTGTGSTATPGITTNESSSSSLLSSSSPNTEMVMMMMEYFTVQERWRFCRRLPPNNHNSGTTTATTAAGSTTTSTTSSTTTTSPEDWFLDEYGLFSSNERTVLVTRILENIPVRSENENDDPEGAELAQLLLSVDDDDLDQHHDATDPQQRRIHRKHGEQQSASLRHVLETYRIVNVVAPVHIHPLRQHIWHCMLSSSSLQWWWRRRWWWKKDPNNTHPIPTNNNNNHMTESSPPAPAVQDLIFHYYGWSVAFYFCWMTFLTRWLFFPGLLGLLFWLLRWYRNDTIEEDEYTPFYGLITFLWGVLFLRFWQREERRLAYRWGTFSLSPYEQQKYFAIRPDFRGYTRASPITGLMETYYPPIYRRLKYVGSAIVTMAMLLMAFAVMIMSLNLQGYIRPQSNLKRWNDQSPHPFHVRSLAVLSEEGRLFDAQSSWRSLIPVVLHVVCIFALNKLYRIVAEALTAWENHETNITHRNSIVLKRFLFEAFDCYVALFYLAFYERDVDRLRLELMSVFQIDTLRRLLLECIVPMMMQRIMAKRTNHRQGNKSKSNGTRNIGGGISKKCTICEDLELDEYDQFDDYMEIVIQLGYVTLFASAYPLASLISIVANWVEIRSDCFKLTNVCRRPESIRSSGLGMWHTLISIVIWTSAITNCLIAGFTSGQLTHYLPEFYIRDKDTGDYNFDDEDGWLVVFVIFGLERVLIILGLIIFAIVPATPEDVVDAIERRQYVRLQQRTMISVINDKKKDD